MPTDAHVSRLRCSNAPDSSAVTKRTTLLVLLADTPIETVRNKLGYPSYHDVFCSLFQRSLDARAVAGCEVLVKSYDVAKEPFEYPSKDDLVTADGLLITGSAANAYDDIPWINRLVDFTSTIPSLYPKLKLFGICYGQQIIARALGGKAEKNPQGWELGVHTVNLTELGQRILLGQNDSGKDTLAIHQVHQDHVPSLPSDAFGLLGSTPVCAVHGFVLPKDPKSLQEVQIFCLQGHPEFSPELVAEIIDAREAKGILTKDFAAECRVKAKLHDDGVPIGAVMLEVLGA